MCFIEGKSACDNSVLSSSGCKIRLRFIDLVYKLTRSVSESATGEFAKLFENILAKVGNLTFLLYFFFTIGSISPV